MRNAKQSIAGYITAILIVVISLGSTAYAAPMAMDNDHCMTQSACMVMEAAHDTAAADTTHNQKTCEMSCCALMIAVLDTDFAAPHRYSQRVIKHPTPLRTTLRAESLHRPPNA